MSEITKPTDLYHIAARITKEYTISKVPNAHDIVIAHVRVNSIRTMVEFVYKAFGKTYHTGTVEFDDNLTVTSGYLSTDDVRKGKT